MFPLRLTPTHEERITPEQFFKLRVTFASQNITSLTLFPIGKLDNAFFRQITVAFTNIQKLSLYAVRWSVDLVCRILRLRAHV